MEYTQLILEIVDRVGVITLNHPPKNSFSKVLLKELIGAFDELEANEQIRTIYLKSTGDDFSRGADHTDITKSLEVRSEEPGESFSELGGKAVGRVDFCPKATIVAAKGRCVGGSTAIFNAFDIRIVGESFSIKDGDIYYGHVGSWGMSSLRLPIWIGRNKVMDYMFLNEPWTARQAYELGLVSKVVPDELLETIGMHYAKKMAIAAPIAVKYYKDCVRKALYSNLAEARSFELEAARFVGATEDSKNGLTYLMRGEQAEFFGR